MSTFLFDSVIVGPIKSRRLGLSLGVNLLPLEHKLCSFDCIYCECGWAEKGANMRYNARETVREQLQVKLCEMMDAGTPPDVITFAGNGEPTMHPEFAAIIDDTIAARDRFSPTAKISVLSNATQIGRAAVRDALMKVDNNIQKLDSAFDQTVQLIDKPNGRYSVAETVEQMKRFNGHVIIQTLFLRGEYNGTPVDNTTEVEVSAWLNRVAEVAPQQVMIYTIDRDTPVRQLQKVSVETLQQIAARVEKLGIPCSVAG